MSYAERSYSYGSGGGGFGGGPAGRFGRFFTPWVTRLIVANGIIWLLNAVRLLPLDWTAYVFGFSPARLLVHPWSPLTYMFVHGGFLHVFLNMLVLFFFGPPLERAWGGTAFIRFYIVAGLGGALASVILVPLIGTPTVIGASAAIYGVMLAFALRWPDAPIYVWGILPIKAKWFVTFLAGVAVWATFVARGGPVAEWAHLGGLVTGYLYLRWGSVLDRGLSAVGRRWTRWTGRGRRGAARGGRGDAGPRPRSTSAGRPHSRRRPSGDTLDEVDRVLDKIRESGMDSLTEEEREFLDEMSRRYRG
ncbi:MAG: rhomboid family intramembrane serine protease [Candidatus Palauibacterales bacterium]|nr:rhomboid family intramembrane serine protease [Candidatus Palauibacterales bacterium]MDP2528229.1 rhomboid family intramembrane serine protease [Candidatus Palauibacterales bacterium]MDP2584889.1 rhomboid family intramembrane serine protease [Candidatus Palauibacterales bacterium]